MLEARCEKSEVVRTRFVALCLGGRSRAKTGTVPRAERSEGLSPAFARNNRGESPIASRQSPVANSRCSLWLVLLVLAGVVSAQPVRSGAATPSQVPGSKYYVWGQVRSPGAYSFVASPDIVELLSAGGGPTENANLGRVVLIQAVSQKRTRIDLQKMMNSGQVLRLAPGDVVIVPSSPWRNVRDWLTVLTSVASLASLVLLIMNRTGV